MLPTISDSRGQSIADFVVLWFIILFFMTGAAAYNVGPVPVPWVANAGMICLAIGMIGFTNRIRIVPGLWILLLFIVWTFLISAVNAGEFRNLMPSRASLPYSVYILIRYINILTFASAVYITYWLVSEGKGPVLVRGLLISGIIIATLSLYIYFAHIFDLPELARTRAGTSGLAQPTIFSGDKGFYHRATGTFREPGQLAEWMILPFFLSFSLKGRTRNIYVAVIGLTILLTVSLTGVIAVVAGGLAGLFLTRPFSRNTYKLLGGAVLLLLFGYFAFTRVTVGLGIEGDSLAEILFNRVTGVFSGGLGKSNRSYIYDFVRENPMPFVGVGIGNGNLLAASFFGNDLVVAFLSLYIFTLYSGGYPALVLLAVFLLRPVLEFLFSFRKYLTSAPVIFMAYLAYLTASGVGSEELTAWFGVTTGLLTFQAHHFYRAKQLQRESDGAVSRPSAIPLSVEGGAPPSPALI